MRYLFSFLAMLLLPFTLSAQERVRGMNVVETLSAQDIVDLGALGANVARFQLHWANFPLADSAGEAEYDAWLDESLEKLDDLLPVFAANGLQVILVLHTPPGGFETRSAPAQHRLFVESWTQPVFLAAWEKIAARYVDNATIWGYDLLNEPAQKRLASGLLSWDDLALEVAKRIRAIDPSRRLILEPIYGDVNKLRRLKLLPMENVVYSPHFYFPPKFTRQGISNNKRVRYPRRKSRSLNKRGLNRALKKVVRYKRKNKVPIYIGEFSVARWAPRNGAYKYLRDLLSIMERKGFSWTYHAWREADVWSIEHTTDKNDPNPSPVKTKRQKLFERYFAR